MDSYTVMVVADERSPVRRFQVPKQRVRRAVQAAAGVGLLLALAVWDYTRVRADNAELADLRVEVAEQREQIDRFEQTLAEADAQLERVRELERKVRIIANLPGAAGVGGEGVTELAPPPGSIPAGQPLAPPAGVPVGPPLPEGFEDDSAALDLEQLELEAMTSDGAQHVNSLDGLAQSLGTSANLQADALDELLGQLEDKRNRLASMPSVWPTRGWLTSRFGPRISPFTGRRQHHAGIDVAAREGTPIHAPARGRVVSIGTRGPLGNSLTIDHGFGVRTFYGHTHEIFVKVGDQVERGDKIASVGSSGRSTGPHLHYAIHVSGKARDPLDYIFD